MFHLFDLVFDLIGESLGKELSGRASKPPVSKVKCGLDLNQHELSTIQEVESPASGRTSMPGKPCGEIQHFTRLLASYLLQYAIMYPRASL